MRKLYATPTFDRLSRKFTEKNPYLKKKFNAVLKIIAKNVFDPLLKTHKLHGPLKEFYACRISYDQRIVFSFDDEKVTLRGVGGHDDIY